MTEEHTNILLVQRNSSDGDSIRDILGQAAGKQFDIRCIREWNTATKILENDDAELIMLDVTEENGRAVELLDKVTTESPSVPCIVLMNSNEAPAEYRTAIEHGARDFLIKDQVTAADIARSMKYVAALRRVRTLEKAVKHQEQLSRLLAAVTEAFLTQDSLTVILRNCAQAVVEELDAALARIWIFESSENMLLLRASAGVCTHLVGEEARIPLGSLKVGRIAADRTPHLTNSIGSDPWISNPEWAAREGMVAFAGYPLLLDDKLLGVIATFSKHSLADSTLAQLAQVSKIISQGLERKRTEQELVAVSRHASRLLEASADALTVMTPEGTITEANLAAEKVYGVARQDLIGKSITELVKDPQRLNESTQAIKLALAQGSVKDFRAHYRKGSGEVIECSINGSVYRDEDGKVEGLIASARDITQQLQLEHQLQYMAAIIEHSSDAIVSETLDGIVTSWNKGAERIYGYSETEMLGKSIFLVIPDTNEHELSDLIERLKEGEAIEHFETLRSRKSGEVFDASLSMSPIKDSAGSIVGLSIISRDISEKKRLERELEYSETLFKQICVGALDGIVCVNQDGAVTVWNGAAERIFGYQADDVIGRNLHLLIAPERYRERFAPALEHFKKTGSGTILGKTLVLEAVRADGTEIPVELSVSSIELNGKWHAVGIVRDITDRRNAEIRMKENESVLQEERNHIARANQLLSSQALDLQKAATQMELMTQMGEYLQICNSDKEAHEIVAQFATKLFPQASGALFTFNESQTWLDKMATWGNPATDTKGFFPDDCWSIRRGQPHLFSDTNPSPRCAHVSPDVKNCLCLPLVLLGEIFGVMHVQWNASTFDKDDEKLVTRLTVDAALALANLKLRQRLKELSLHDPLTGLFNRRYMEEFFSQELGRSRRNSTQLSVIMIDIDHFKNFNDTFGHEAGDAVLHELGRLLKGQLRESDVTCRFGGEEFVLLLSESPIEVARQRAEKLRQEVKLMRVKVGDKQLPEINISLGLAAFPIHGQSMDEIIKAADRALYQAKEKGRDCVCVAPLESDAVG
ncbi:MAG: PAS domain S-box protein [Candidatus Melainabacteria bacterium]|nr:PAS domain S-box protein [Candidatus Melainabacteria bacterium]